MNTYNQLKILLSVVEVLQYNKAAIPREDVSNYTFGSQVSSDIILSIEGGETFFSSFGAID